MPKFYFHLTHDLEVRDHAGVELEDLHSAKCHAVKMIADTLCEQPEKFWKHDTYRVSVADAQDLLLLSVEMIAQAAPALWQTPLRSSE